MGDPYLDALLQDAKAFQALSPATHAEVQTYILAVIADTLYSTGTDPDHLAYLSRCFGCLNPSTLLEAKVYLMADLAQFDLTPNTLLYYARCYPCIPEGSFPEVISYLYSGDPNGPGINDPSLLAQAAKDFQKLSPITLLQIQVYLLALIDEVAPDPNTIADLARCFRCFPYPYLIATFIQSLDYLEPLPDPDDAPNRNPPPGSPHDPPPRPDHPPTRDNNGRGGGGIPVCTDTALGLIPVLTANYTAYTLTSISAVIPKACCRGTSEYELWGADEFDFSDGVLLDTASTGGNHGQVNVAFTIDMTGQTNSHFRIRQVCGSLQSDWSNIVALNSDPATAEDWADRVVANGGARPSDQSIYFAGAFSGALRSSGLFSKMKAVNMIAPDSLIAAITPLIVGSGNDPWTNTNFVDGDLTVDGLKGDGVGKWLDTGISPTAVFANDTNAGLTAYSYSGYTGIAQEVLLGNKNGADQMILQNLVISGDKSMSWDAWNPVAGRTSATRYTHGGYYSGNRTAVNVSSIFFGNPHYAHSQIATVATTAGTRQAPTLGAFAAKDLGGVVANTFCSRRLSFLAIHEGLVAAESLALYNAVRAMRVGFGGGYLPEATAATSIVNDWSRRVIAGGGAEPSAATKTALTTFWNALITAGIHSKMIMVNPIAPDNLTAAITPLFRAAGLTMWENTGFLDGDLSVNGLQGAVGKRLNTTAYADRTFLSLTSGGLTAYWVTYPLATGNQFMGASASPNQIALQPFNSNTLFDCWTFNAGGRLSVANTQIGFWSGNRTAANDFRLYRANRSSAFTTAASAATTAGAIPLAQLYCWSVLNTTNATNQASFAAYHEGLTAAEAEDFYDAIDALRGALGGGYVG